MLRSALDAMGIDTPYANELKEKMYAAQTEAAIAESLKERANSDGWSSLTNDEQSKIEAAYRRYLDNYNAGRPVSQQKSFSQTELERDWFRKHNYEAKTFYEMINLEYENNYPTHSFLVFKDNDNTWNWFENSDFENRGIHKFGDLKSLMDYQISKYKELLATKNIKEEELKFLTVKEFDKPYYNITAEEYINHVLNSNDYKGV